jgi:glycosyltransferase involved in cell wall biosynthesis
MRVLMLSQFYPPVIGGEERHVLSLSEGLVKRGHQVAVAAMPHRDRADVEAINGVSVHSMRGTFQRAPALFSESERPHAPPFPDPELTFKLNRLVGAFKPDIVHGHNWLIHSYLPTRLWRRVGLVSTLHDFSLTCPIKTLMRGGAHCEGPKASRCLPCAGNHFGLTMGKVTAAAHFAFKGLHRKGVDRFIAVSRAVAEKSGIVDGPIAHHVLPTFIPDDVGKLSAELDPRLDQLPGDGFLLFVGELNRNKGVHILLDAYSKLQSAPPLVLIGRRCPDTPENLPRNVFLFESWPHSAVMHAWSRCLFGLAPSTWVEPCGTIVMEANAMGKTMIASNHGGLAELVDHERTGLLTPPNDATALAAAMQSLIADQGRRDALAQGARAKADSFMAKSIIPRIESIYRDVRFARAPQAATVEMMGATSERRHGR